MDASRILILGANGQLGTKLREMHPKAKTADISELDITNKQSVVTYPWQDIDIIINAAAFTKVDEAETETGKDICYKVNRDAVGFLATVAASRDLTLVHISSDYVFDGSKEVHTETEPFHPLNKYGKSKAEGDLLASKASKHYILRTSWVIGEGTNFVRTMLSLAERNISPEVVSDQTGRLTFTSEIVRAIDFLLSKEAPFGTYNISNDGPVVSWADIARGIFAYIDRPDLIVTDISSMQYAEKKPGTAQRPQHSTLDLSKLHALGFKSNYWKDDLLQYIQKETKQ